MTNHRDNNKDPHKEIVSMSKACLSYCAAAMGILWTAAAGAQGLPAEEPTVAQAMYQDLSFWVWPLGIVLAAGVFWCTGRYGIILLEGWRAKRLTRTPLTGLTLKEADVLVGKSPRSQVGALLRGMLDVAGVSGNGYEIGLADVNEEITLYRESINDRFDGFKSVSAFLSNSAGALGLLGTVWGIYVTFKGGEMDPQKIIDGMGVALSTTGCGIVISLIIDFLNSMVIAAHVSRVESGFRKAEELRVAILTERRRAEQASSPTVAGGHKR
jgi:hypothetical protein